MELQEIKKLWIEFVAGIDPADRKSVYDAITNFYCEYGIEDYVDNDEWDTELHEFYHAHYYDMEETVLDNAD